MNKLFFLTAIGVCFLPGTKDLAKIAPEIGEMRLTRYGTKPNTNAIHNINMVKENTMNGSKFKPIKMEAFSPKSKVCRPGVMKK